MATNTNLPCTERGLPMHYVDMIKQYYQWQRDNMDDARMGEDARHSEAALGVLTCQIVATSALAGDMKTARRFSAKMRRHAATVEAEHRLRCSAMSTRRPTA